MDRTVGKLFLKETFKLLQENMHYNKNLLSVRPELVEGYERYKFLSKKISGYFFTSFFLLFTLINFFILNLFKKFRSYPSTSSGRTDKLSFFSTYNLLFSHVFLLFSIISIATEPTIALHLLSLDGQEVTEVAVGEPFRVEVLIEGMGQKAPRTIEVPGLDKINARRNGYFLTTINGVSSVKFNYQAQVDRPTFVTIGPVMVTYEGKEIQSKKLRVIAKVGDPTTSSKTMRSKKETNDPMLRLYVDKKDAVVGEKITARLRFYARGQEVQLRQLNHRDLPAFTMTPFENPTTGQETIDGQAQPYVEWRWYLYPKEAGKLVIPAYSIDYDKVIQHTSQWSFLSLFGTRMENKRVHSNAQVITAKELPAHNGPLFLVGKLVDARAEISPTTIKVGDAATLAIEIEGEGNIEGIEQIVLTGMPSTLKYYDFFKKYDCQSNQSRKTYPQAV